MTQEAQARRQQTARGIGGGVTRSAVGAFVLAMLVEIGLIPSDVGPNTLILLTWVFGQVLHSALSPKQWRDLLGR